MPTNNCDNNETNLLPSISPAFVSLLAAACVPATMAEPLAPPLDRRASATAKTWDTAKRHSLAKKYIDTIGRNALLRAEVDHHALQMHLVFSESKGIGYKTAMDVRAHHGHQPSGSRAHLPHSPPCRR